MNPTLAGVALAVTAGAVIAASAREARAAYLGLALALCLGPFLADPLPGPAILGARVVTGILVVYLLRFVSGGADARGFGSRLGWPAEAVFAAAAAIAGVALAGSLASLGPGDAVPAPTIPDALTPAALALATGFACISLGFTPALLSRIPTRTVVGLLLVAHGLVLARTGLAGPPGELEQLAVAGVLLAIGAAGTVIAAFERRAVPDGVPPRAAVPDAR
jgi:hypothetical protein